MGGHLVPTLIAFVQTACGYYIFHDACKGGPDQLISTLIFLFSTFLILWKLKVIPSSIRSQSKFASIVLQYLMSQFVLEHFMNDFWYPLESSLFSYVPKLADCEYLFWRKLGLRNYGLMRISKAHAFTVFVTYVVALMCLMTVFKSGASASLADTAKHFRRKIKKFYKRVRKSKSCNSVSHCDGSSRGGHGSSKGGRKGCR